MITPKISVLKYMYRRYLPRYIRYAAFPIEVWKYTRGMHTDCGEYSKEDFEGEIRLGDRWRASYDSAHWFSSEITVPEGFDGKEMRLEFNIGGEALIRVNGVIRGSVTQSPGSQHREVIIINEKFNAGDVLKIDIEATVNSGDFCDEAMAGARDTEYTFKKAELTFIDTVAEGYWYDLQVGFEALDAIKDDYIRNAVYQAIDDSLHIVDFDFEEERVRESIAKAADYYREALSNIKYVPQSDVIYTSHSHIDVAWLWRIQESVRKGARTFSNNMALMDKYPEMTFAQSQAVLYDMMKRYYPDVYAKIKEKVANGQWDIVGNVWVEADTNIASGEALIRQLLYGREYFLTEFGTCSDTYWLPDCFGFSWALPQIIKRSGMKYFLTSKLNNNDTNRFPHTLFRWKGNNGDEIVAYLQRPSYNGEYRVSELMECETNDEKALFNTTMAMFGHGDGGGGAMHEMLERGKRLKNFPGLPSTSIGHVDRFFDKISEDYDKLPVWNHEMYYENHRGTYTSQAFVKKNNRKNEYRLSRGEMTSLFACALAGGEYPKAELEECWKILLTNQFHDILPGSSIHEVYEDARRDYAALSKRTSAVLADAIKRLNSKLKIEKDSVAVWNLTSLEQTCPVNVEVPCAGLCAVDENGDILPSTVTEKEGRFILTFTAPALPPMGCKVFALAKAENTAPAVKAEKTLLENSKLRVTLDENAIITSIYDKVNCRETLDGKGNLLSVSQDKCDHETAWNLEINYRKKMWELDSADSVEVTESNAQRGVIRVVRSFNKSTITQDIILNADSDELVFDTSVDWWETDKVLKAAFDVAVINTEATYDIAHGAIKRPTHSNTCYDAAMFEVCGHKWADLSEGGYGVSLLNDCKYGYDIHDSKMRITLMRAPTCPDPTGDHGVSTFVYTYYPHKNGWQDAETVRKALALNVAPVASFLTANNGEFDKVDSLITLSCDNVIIDAVKQAQDGNGIILRVVETQQRRGSVTVDWKLPASKVFATNLMETDEGEIEFANGRFSFDIKPFDVLTFRIV